MAPGQKPVHLVEIGLSWPPETFLQWKLAGLVERGFRVTVASAYENGSGYTLPGVEVVSVDNEDLTEPADLRPDVVHFEWESAAVTYMPLADMWGCPVVMSCHGSLAAHVQSPRSAWVLAGLRMAFERAALVQCVSEVDRAEAIRLGLDPARARVVPCGVDPCVFSPPEPGTRAGGMLRVVAVGTLRWMKGQEYALRTLRTLLDSGVPAELDLIGGDPLPPVGIASDRARILHTVEDLELGDHVRVHGHLPTDEVVRHLHRGHAFLHSSVSEGLPVVILEAMACGLPVVTTDCGGVREELRDGVEGYVVPPRDPAQAAEALERLWLDPELRERMGQAGTERVRSEFTLERHLDQMEALYREVTRDSGRPLATTRGA